MKSQAKALNQSKNLIRQSMSYKIIEDKKEQLKSHHKGEKENKEEKDEVDRLLGMVSRESMRQFLRWVNREKEEIGSWKQAVERLTSHANHLPLLDTYQHTLTNYKEQQQNKTTCSASIESKVNSLCLAKESKTRNKKMYRLVVDNLRCP